MLGVFSNVFISTLSRQDHLPNRFVWKTYRVSLRHAMKIFQSRFTSHICWKYLHATCVCSREEHAQNWYLTLAPFRGISYNFEIKLVFFCFYFKNHLIVSKSKLGSIHKLSTLQTRGWRGSPKCQQYYISLLKWRGRGVSKILKISFSLAIFIV